MQDLDSLLTQLREHRPAAWDQLPDFALYMDQVLNYMDRQVIRFDEADGLTAAMVNNNVVSITAVIAGLHYLSPVSSKNRLTIHSTAGNIHSGM